MRNFLRILLLSTVLVGSGKVWGVEDKDKMRFDATSGTVGIETAGWDDKGQFGDVDLLVRSDGVVTIRPTAGVKGYLGLGLLDSAYDNAKGHVEWNGRTYVVKVDEGSFKGRSLSLPQNVQSQVKSLFEASGNRGNGWKRDELTHTYYNEYTGWSMSGATTSGWADPGSLTQPKREGTTIVMGAMNLTFDKAGDLLLASVGMAKSGNNYVPIIEKIDGTTVSFDRASGYGQVDISDPQNYSDLAGIYGSTADGYFENFGVKIVSVGGKTFATPGDGSRVTVGQVAGGEMPTFEIDGRTASYDEMAAAGFGDSWLNGHRNKSTDGMTLRFENGVAYNGEYTDKNVRAHAYGGYEVQGEDGTWRVLPKDAVEAVPLSVRTSADNGRSGVIGEAIRAASGDFASYLVSDGNGGKTPISSANVGPGLAFRMSEDGKSLINNKTGVSMPIQETQKELGYLALVKGSDGSTQGVYIPEGKQVSGDYVVAPENNIAGKPLRLYKRDGDQLTLVDGQVFSGIPEQVGNAWNEQNVHFVVGEGNALAGNKPAVVTDVNGNVTGFTMGDSNFVYGYDSQNKRLGEMMSQSQALQNNQAFLGTATIDSDALAKAVTKDGQLVGDLLTRYVNGEDLNGIQGWPKGVSLSDIQNVPADVLQRATEIHDAVKAVGAERLIGLNFEAQGNIADTVDKVEDWKRAIDNTNATMSDSTKSVSDRLQAMNDFVGLNDPKKGTFHGLLPAETYNKTHDSVVDASDFMYQEYKLDGVQVGEGSFDGKEGNYAILSEKDQKFMKNAYGLQIGLRDQNGEIIPKTKGILHTDGSDLGTAARGYAVAKNNYNQAMEAYQGATTKYQDTVQQLTDARGALEKMDKSDPKYAETAERVKALEAQREQDAIDFAQKRRAAEDAGEQYKGAAGTFAAEERKATEAFVKDNGFTGTALGDALLNNSAQDRANIQAALDFFSAYKPDGRTEGLFPPSGATPEEFQAWLQNNPNKDFASAYAALSPEAQEMVRDMVSNRGGPEFDPEELKARLAGAGKGAGAEGEAAGKLTPETDGKLNLFPSELKVWDLTQTGLEILGTVLNDNDFDVSKNVIIHAGEIGEAVGPVDPSAIADAESATLSGTAGSAAATVSALLKTGAVDLGLLSEKIAKEEEENSTGPVAHSADAMAALGQGYGQDADVFEEPEADTPMDSEFVKEIRRRRAELLRQYVNSGIQISEGMNAISKTFYDRADGFVKVVNPNVTQTGSLGGTQDAARMVLLETIRGTALSGVQMGVQGARLLNEQEVVDETSSSN